jgi:uncharacterized protein (DUF779 family)
VGADGEARVSATPPVLELLERLAARYGPLLIHQSGGCCDGRSPICLPADELPAGPHDVLLGVVGSTRVYVDRDQNESWQRRTLRIGVSPGPAMSFSLESAEGVNLVALQGKADSASATSRGVSPRA